jgi:hypothetical protein
MFHNPAVLGARGDRERKFDPEAVEERLEIARDPDCDHGHDGDVLQEQVPADEPPDDLTERDVAVRVRRASSRDHAGKLGVGQSGGRRSQAGDEESDQHGGAHAGVCLRRHAPLARRVRRCRRR